MAAQLMAAAAVAVILLQYSVMKPADVIAKQHIAQRQIMLPQLNEHLFALKQQGVLHGKICTSYLPMRFIPDLSDRYTECPLDLTQPITAKVMDTIDNRIDERLLLAPQTSFNKESEDWLKEHNCRILLEQDFYRLVELPKAKRAPNLAGRMIRQF